ncbi:MAG: hypothetical protein AAGH79_11590 [Bacteroidota bacterium]
MNSNNQMMSHYEIYFSARRRVILITFFFLLLGILQFLIDVFFEGSSNFTLSVVKLAFYGVLGHQLLAGQNWAVTVTSILCALNIAFLLFGFLGSQTLSSIIASVTYIAAFAFIIWYLTTDTTYQYYSELKAHGFDPVAGQIVAFTELTKNIPIQQIAIHEVNTIDRYTELSKELLQKAGLYENIESLEQDETGKKILAETADTVFEIPVNDRLKIMDKGFVHRINSIIQALGSEQRFQYVYPESILKPDGTNHYLVFGSDQLLTKLRQQGFARRE